MGNLDIDSQPNKNEVRREVMLSAGYVRRQKWTHPGVGTATAIYAAINSNAVVTTGITQPDFPRVLSVTGAGSGHSAAGVVTINGTDIRGNVIADAITLNGSTTVNGVKAFATVTSIDLSAVTGNDANDTVEVGTTSLLGLDRMMDADEYLQGSYDGTFEATRATITYSSTVLSQNTVSFNTALSNTHTYRAVYVTKELTNSNATTS